MCDSKEDDDQPNLLFAAVNRLMGSQKQSNMHANDVQSAVL
jgi:hypothetical protein